MALDKSRLEKMSKEEKLLYYDLLQERKRRKREKRDVFVPNEGQLPVLQSTAPQRFVISGNGCLAHGTKVIMYDGSLKEAQDVEVGDVLLGPDSAPRVVQVLWRGKEQMYRITPADGSGQPFVCNANHRLSLQYCSNDGRYGLKQGDVIDVTVKEYLSWADRKKRLFYGWRPDRVEFNGGTAPDLQIDPYILGLWLGDGHSADTRFTNEDPSIIDSFTTYAVAIGDSLQCNSRGQSAGRAETYNIKGNQFRRRLRFYNLLNNKHVPSSYKTASLRQRALLLAGLLDTDGSYSNRCPGYEITQKRKALAEDIAWLARSLGLKAKIKEKIIGGTAYWRVALMGPVWRIPCRVNHKQSTAPKLQRNCTRYKISVEAVGEDDFYGFTLSDDQQFLLDDFTVTFNSGKTALAVNSAIYAAQGYNPHTKEFTKVPAKIIVVLDSPEKVSEVWLPELQKWYNLQEEQLHKMGRPFVQKIIFPNGSYIFFMFIDQSPMRFESIEADYVLCDEPPPRHVYVALRRGLRKKGTKPKVLCVGTPITGGWIRTDLYEPWSRGELKDVEFFRFSTDVNRDNLADGYIESFFGSLSAKERAIRQDGQFFDIDGLALAHLFDRKRHIIPFESLEWNFPVYPCVIAMDPHPSKKHYAVLLGCDDHDRLFVLDTYSAKKTGTGFITDLIDKCKWFDFNVVDVVYDSLGSAENTSGEGFKSFGQAVKDVLKARGLCGARATTYKEKSDEDFIERIRECLTIYEDEEFPRLRFSSHVYDIITEVENVQWAKQRLSDENKPKLDISNRDLLACLKYALATNLNSQKGSKQRIYRPTRMPYLGGRDRQSREAQRFRIKYGR